MKPTAMTRITTATLLATLAIPAQIIAQEQSATQEEMSERVRYTIVDLGKVGGPPGQPYVIANNGLIAGAAAIPDGAMHAVLWYMGLKLDIGTPGLGGPNSAAFGINKSGHAVGEAETLDPNGEDFCGFKALGLPVSGTSCAPFLWRYGTMTRLPTLGGANGVANMINNRGEAAGLAENKTQDKGCAVFQFKPVIWKDGEVHELPTFRGDRDLSNGNTTFVSNFDPSAGVVQGAFATPEPASIALVAIGIAPIVICIRRRRARSRESLTAASRSTGRHARIVNAAKCIRTRSRRLGAHQGAAPIDATVY